VTASERAPAARRGDAAASERVVRYIRRLVERQRLKPGDRLPTERQLARETGLSRPSVRSGLRSLAAMGVVLSRRGAGTFIQNGPVTLDSEPLSLLATLHGVSYPEMFLARLVLEAGIAALAAERATPDQTSAMADEVAAMFASLEDPQTFLLHDVRFHRAVAAGSNNAVLAAVVEMVSTLVYGWRRRTIERARDLRESAEMHRRIYQAIRRRDMEAAHDAMTEHLRLALARVAAEEPGTEVRARRVPAALRRRRA
jgi:GntR family transcriptional repressor for pyruvate dehydrogenase complex